MPTAITQPTPLVSEDGMIFTVGLLCNGDRCEIVMPIAKNGTIDPVTECANAIEAFGASSLRADLLAILSSDTSLMFEQCVSMVSGGIIPSRVDFAITDHPGTRASGPMPSREGALGIYYGDPATPSPKNRIRVAKQFFPGIAQADVTGDKIADALGALVETFLAHMSDGTFSTAGKGPYYRVTAAEGTAATNLCGVKLVEYRQYTGTIRRRTLPH